MSIYRIPRRTFVGSDGRRYRYLTRTVTLTMTEGGVIRNALKLWLKTEPLALTIFDELPNDLRKRLKEDHDAARRLLRVLDGQYTEGDYTDAD